MELFAHQQRLVTQNPPRHLLAWGTGTGKTKGALALAEKNLTGNQSLLVVCPKGLKVNWERECVRFVGADFWIRVMTKEEFRRDWSTLPKFDAVIIDEAHTFAGTKSQLHKDMLKYLKKYDIKYRWLLTATPFLRNAWNIFALGKILGVPWDFFSFRRKFFYERMLGQRTFWDARPGMEQEVAGLVNTLGSTVKLEDCIDIPEASFEVEYFAFTAAQKSAIKAVKETLPIVRFTKYHQIAGGVLKGNEYEPTKRIDCDKVRRVLELAEENPKMIISCRYLGEMEMLAEELKDHEVFLLNGDTQNKQEIVDLFNATPKAILIVNAMCSEGWQAPSSQLIVFYSYDFSLKNKIQMEGRIRRIDKPQKVTYLALVTEKSIDVAVVEALSRKMDFDAAIYNYKD